MVLGSFLTTLPPPENLLFNTDPTNMEEVVNTKSDLSNPDGDQVVVSSISKNEPLVTRRELWSYYRAYQYNPVPFTDQAYYQCIIMVTM